MADLGRSIIDYVRSPMLHNPNRLAFTITLPGTDNVKDKVPAGIRSPKTFIQVGEYLYYLLINEIKHGDDPFLRKFTSRPTALTNTFKMQFTAWAQGSYPFAIGLGPGQTPLQYWRVYEGSEDAGVLAVSRSDCISPQR